MVISNKPVLLACLLQLIVHTTGQFIDTCIPNYFQYMKDETTGEITSGRISVHKVPIGIPLQLGVALGMSAQLPMKNVGPIELAQSEEQSIEAIQQGWPLKYNIYFPLRRLIPTLTGLWFNNQLICKGEHEYSHHDKHVVLNYTLNLPRVASLKIGDAPTPLGVHISTQQSVSSKATVAVPVITSNSKIISKPKQPSNRNCGRNDNLGRTIGARVVGGLKISPGQWPWLAAIYITKSKLWLQCAGTLVTNTHVITAAQCFQGNNGTLPPEIFLVSLGHYALLKWGDTGIMNREVASYELHPDYVKHNQDPDRSADADLAVVTLRGGVEFSAMIRPVCLWTGPKNLDLVVGMQGFVVGWGSNEFGTRHLEEPLLTRSTIVSQITCLRSNRDFISITSDRTFCAGSPDGSGPCNGDSGSGFIMYDKNSDRYYLRGIVSRELFDMNTFSCNLTQYVVFVDVSQHLNWIQQQIST